GSPSGITGFPANSNPQGITSGPDGNLWFTQQAAKQVGRITTAGAITAFPVTGHPFEITTRPDLAIWFTQSDARIGRHDPAGARPPPGVRAPPRQPARGNHRRR